jgi:hypothetical protein
MAAKHNIEGVSLSEEYRVEMARLYIEAVKHFEGMYQIVARALGFEGGRLTEVRFIPERDIERAKEASPTAMVVSPIADDDPAARREPVIICYLDDQGNCGCYDKIRQECYPCP